MVRKQPCESELLLRGKTTRTPPEPLENIERKEKLKQLCATFEQVPVKVTVDLQRPNFANVVFFAPDIAKTSI